MESNYGPHTPFELDGMADDVEAEAQQLRAVAKIVRRHPESWRKLGLDLQDHIFSPAARAGSGNRMDEAVTLVITKPGAGTWARVNLKPDLFALLKRGAEACGQSVGEFVEHAVQVKLKAEVANWKGGAR